MNRIDPTFDITPSKIRMNGRKSQGHIRDSFEKPIRDAFSRQSDNRVLQNRLNQKSGLYDPLGDDMVRIEEAPESNRNYEWDMDGRRYDKSTRPIPTDSIKVSKLLQSVGDKNFDKRATLARKSRAYDTTTDPDTTDGGGLLSKYRRKVSKFVNKKGAPVGYNIRYQQPINEVQMKESDPLASNNEEEHLSKKSHHRSKLGNRVLVEEDYADMAEKSPSNERARQKSMGSRSGSGGRKRRPKTKQSHNKGSRGTPLYYQSPGGDFDIDNFTAHLSARRSSQKLHS